MTRTIIIMGATFGFDPQTTHHVHRQGLKLVATMRNTVPASDDATFLAGIRAQFDFA